MELERVNVVNTVITRWADGDSAARASTYIKEHGLGMSRLWNGLTYGGLFSVKQAYEVCFAYVAHQVETAPPTVDVI